MSQSSNPSRTRASYCRPPKSSVFESIVGGCHSPPKTGDCNITDSYGTHVYAAKKANPAGHRCSRVTLRALSLSGPKGRPKRGGGRTFQRMYKFRGWPSFVAYHASWVWGPRMSEQL